MGHGTTTPFLGIPCVPDHGFGIVREQVTDDVANQRPIKAVVAGRNGRVGGEQRSLSELFSAPPLTQHFEHGKGAVPFVEVHAGEVMPERLEGTNTSHTQQVFLTDASVIVATVQPGSQPDELRRVVGMEGVKEIHGDDVA